MRAIIKSGLFTAVFLTLALAVLPVTAQIQPADCGDLGISCDGTPEALKNKIMSIVNTGLTLASVVAVIVIIYGGVKYILSNGEDKQVDNAKHIILYAVIGLIVIGLAAAIVNFTIGAVGGDAGGAGGGDGGDGGDGGNPAAGIHGGII